MKKNRNRDRQQSLVRDSRRLPAKNRKKGAIIDALMSDSPIPPLKPNPNSKPKTIRHRSIESILEEKRIEALFKALEF